MVQGNASFFMETSLVLPTGTASPYLQIPALVETGPLSSSLRWWR